MLNIQQIYLFITLRHRPRFDHGFRVWAIVQIRVTCTVPALFRLKLGIFLFIFFLILYRNDWPTGKSSVIQSTKYNLKCLESWLNSKIKTQSPVIYLLSPVGYTFQALYGTRNLFYHRKVFQGLAVPALCLSNKKVSALVIADRYHPI